MSIRRIEAKTVVITGGTGGIGFEAAKTLLETKQYKLILIGKDGDKLKKAAQSLDASSEMVQTFACDLADPAQIKKTVDKITLLNARSGIYGVINNAGVYPFGNATNTTLNIWNEAMDINLRAAFLVIQGLLPLLTKSIGGARIINVSSTAGILPNHFALAYSVSKAALIHLTKTLAKELGKDGITVNCLCPGIIKSPMHEAYHPSEGELEEFYAKRGSSIPLGRVGEPSDVAGAIRFFLSPEASWLTGDICVIDGGRLLL